MSKGIASLAKQVASKGRGGDSTLLHIHPSELAGIEATLRQLDPDVKITLNPETGMYEAFSWKKLLGAVGLGLSAAMLVIPGLQPAAIAGLKGSTAALLSGVVVPSLVSGAAGLAAGAFAPDTNKQNQQALSGAQKWKEENAKPEYARQRFMSNAYAGVTKPQEQQPQQQPTPPALTGIASTLRMSPLHQPDTLNMAEGGELEPEEQKAQKIIRDAMDAIRGEGDDPESALNTYLAYYGKEALQDLYKRMSGEGEQEREDQDSDEYSPPEGMIKGPGNGMDDMATARMAHGGQKVLLSNDEFIIPADVVSGLGDGSSEAGARKLYAMMDRIRKDRTGTTKQPGKVNDSRVLPA